MAVGQLPVGLVYNVGNSGAPWGREHVIRGYVHMIAKSLPSGTSCPSGFHGWIPSLRRDGGGTGAVPPTVVDQATTGSRR